MLRLKLMPLVKDFGETLNPPLGKLSPYISLLFTRDLRIFGQFSHFPRSLDQGYVAKRSTPIQVMSLPKGLKLISADEDGRRVGRKDVFGYEIVFVQAEQLKSLIVPEDTTTTNKATIAYIQELPDDTVVIMEWQ
jgi:hypothetical protein